MDAAERLLVLLRGLDSASDIRGVTSAMTPQAALAAD
jgi:hypothetical protein